MIDKEKTIVRDCGLFHTIATMLNRGLSVSFAKGILIDGIVITMNRKNVFTRTVIPNDHMSIPCLDNTIRNELFNMETKIIEEENKYE